MKEVAKCPRAATTVDRSTVPLRGTRERERERDLVSRGSSALSL